MHAYELIGMSWTHSCMGPKSGALECKDTGSSGKTGSLVDKEVVLPSYVSDQLEIMELHCEWRKLTELMVRIKGR